MLDLVGKNQRAGFELVVLIAGHGQAIVHGANVSALHVFNHQIQAIQTRAQRHGLLINRLQLQRLLIEGIGEIATDGVFKSLHDAAGERGNAPENVDDGGVDAFLGLEGKLSVGNLHGNAKMKSQCPIVHRLSASLKADRALFRSALHKYVYLCPIRNRTPLRLYPAGQRAGRPRRSLLRRGKSGLHGTTVPGNARRPRRRPGSGIVPQKAYRPTSDG